MTSSASSPTLTSPRAVAAEVDGERLRVQVADGREIDVPISWFAFLERATEDQRTDLRIIGGGAGIWWEQLEDAVSVPQLFGLPPDS
jgi:hypothetical protein